jgi:hypothetical protein
MYIGRSRPILLDSSLFGFVPTTDDSLALKGHHVGSPG